MITIENVTIYKCDFCKKELKRKHSMIKQLLGEKFISLEYVEGKYNSWTCIIKFKK